MHLLLFLHSEDHFLNMIHIDEIIFTEFSNSEQNSVSELINIVQFIMIYDLYNVYILITLYISAE